MRIKILFSFLAFSTVVIAQPSSKVDAYFAEPIILDSLSTMFIPVYYDAKLFSSNKIAAFGEYYANIVVYDFKVDQYRKLFPGDTFIEPIITNDYRYIDKMSTQTRNVSKDWIFLKVKSVDYSGNGKIDELDPSILYVCTRNGTGLKRLTPENEHVVSLTFYEKQGFALVKLLRDSDNDRSFRAMDKVTYFVKIDLKTLASGHPIEVN